MGDPVDKNEQQTDTADHAAELSEDQLATVDGGLHFADSVSHIMPVELAGNELAGSFSAVPPAGAAANAGHSSKRQYRKMPKNPV